MDLSIALVFLHCSASVERKMWRTHATNVFDSLICLMVVGGICAHSQKVTAPKARESTRAAPRHFGAARSAHHGAARRGATRQTAHRSFVALEHLAAAAGCAASWRLPSHHHQGSPVQCIVEPETTQSHRPETEERPFNVLPKSVAS